MQISQAVLAVMLEQVEVVGVLLQTMEPDQSQPRRRHVVLEA